jgi:hypothetical protein
MLLTVGVSQRGKRIGSVPNYFYQRGQPLQAATLAICGSILTWQLYNVEGILRHFKYQR